MSAQSMKTVLALETSCDESALAVLKGREVLAAELASQVAEHEKYGGVVPEIASRNHLIQVPQLLRRALRRSGIDLATIDGFAATGGPGLASSLMIGASVAKGLAISLGKPYLAINHLEGHLLSPFFPDTPIDPHFALIVSGGHTMAVKVSGVGHYEIIGRTVDDAAGEAFDKVAKLLGLGYPGGPEIEECAKSGDATRYDFPRSMIDSDDFSFSGLKTAVRYLLAKLTSNYATTLEATTLSDLCASFQQAVIDVLLRKALVAAKKNRLDLITLSGGVSCNQELVRQFGVACARERIRFKAAPRSLSTDNAVMIAFAALLRLEEGAVSSVTAEIDPNLALA